MLNAFTISFRFHFLKGVCLFVISWYAQILYTAGKMGSYGIMVTTELCLKMGNSKE